MLDENKALKVCVGSAGGGGGGARNDTPKLKTFGLLLRWFCRKTNGRSIFHLCPVVRICIHGYI